MSMTPSTSRPAALTEAQRVATRKPIEVFFARMTAVVGVPAVARLFDTTDTALVHEEWQEGLAMLTPQEIDRGFATLRTRGKFAPNLPEFLQLCRPALDPETAWHEAERGFRAHSQGIAFPWSHPAVFWCGRDFRYELTSSSFAEQRKRWERRLAEWFSVGSYPDIPDATAARITNEPSQESFASSFVTDHRERLGRIREKLAAALLMQPAARRVADPQEIVPGSVQDIENTQRLKAEAAHRYRSWLVANGLACDGSHGGAPCADPRCWQL